MRRRTRVRFPPPPPLCESPGRVTDRGSRAFRAGEGRCSVWAGPPRLLASVPYGPPSGQRTLAERVGGNTHRRPERSAAPKDDDRVPSKAVGRGGGRGATDRADRGHGGRALRGHSCPGGQRRGPAGHRRGRGREVPAADRGGPAGSRRPRAGPVRPCHGVRGCVSATDRGAAPRRCGRPRSANGAGAVRRRPGSPVARLGVRHGRRAGTQRRPGARPWRGRRSGPGRARRWALPARAGRSALGRRRHARAAGVPRRSPPRRTGDRGGVRARGRAGVGGRGPARHQPRCPHGGPVSAEFGRSHGPRRCSCCRSVACGPARRSGRAGRRAAPAG